MNIEEDKAKSEWKLFFPREDDNESYDRNGFYQLSESDIDWSK